jgi:hypothetical protein
MTDGEIDAYCLDWQYWCKTRGYYLQPGAKNILARMQPSRVGVPPNGRNSPDMQFFNMAIHALADMREHMDTALCFGLYYPLEGPRADNIKRVADHMGIARSTYYRRVMAFARKAHSMSLSLKKVHNAGKLEVEMTID